MDYSSIYIVMYLEDWCGSGGGIPLPMMVRHATNQKRKKILQTELKAIRRVKTCNISACRNKPFRET